MTQIVGGFKRYSGAQAPRDSTALDGAGKTLRVRISAPAREATARIQAEPRIAPHHSHEIALVVALATTDAGANRHVGTRAHDYARSPSWVTDSAEATAATSPLLPFLALAGS